MQSTLWLCQQKCRGGQEGGRAALLHSVGISQHLLPLTCPQLQDPWVGGVSQGHLPAGEGRAPWLTFGSLVLHNWGDRGGPLGEVAEILPGYEAPCDRGFHGGRGSQGPHCGPQQGLLMLTNQPPGAGFLAGTFLGHLAGISRRPCEEFFSPFLWLRKRAQKNPIISSKSLSVLVPLGCYS